jgi:hypothetical protein
VLARYFMISERGSTVAREIRGGLVTSSRVPHHRGDALHLLDRQRRRCRLHQLGVLACGNRPVAGVHPLMCVVAVLFVGYFAEAAAGSWLGVR